MNTLYIYTNSRRPHAISRIARLILLICLFLGIYTFCSLRQDELVRPIAEKVLRFRVLAASDSPEDQAVKLDVRDAVLSWLEEKLPDSRSAEETSTFLSAHLEDLNKVAVQAASDSFHTAFTGSDTAPSVKITLGDCYFPEKRYGNLTFPRGNYHALKIEIGEAAGKNWWCVLYPTLCFTDAVTMEIPEESEQILKNVLAEEDYAILEKEENQIQFRFWIWDWFRGLWE